MTVKFNVYIDDCFIEQEVGLDVRQKYICD